MMLLLTVSFGNVSCWQIGRYSEEDLICYIQDVNILVTMGLQGFKYCVMPIGSGIR